ncbi:hypothetical protein CROQUDRAFT_96745 [Cronartium quercuum f. sp. fusiforme G11]|uniref:Uncharacterized protein n=1 Tax=Cronartium quercuum f. sp. fusiforme G11 TaxID=708437 RepID=A0A9P6T8G0_9BASI|nr:hypothetical protein CROQUDRAFT_96745 [Cronartium quercuum f. sp. fusiforme G11]
MYPKAETGLPEVHAPKPTKESKSQSTLTSISSSYPTIEEALSIVSGMQKKEIGSDIEENTKKNQDITRIVQIPSTINKEIPNPSVVIDSKENSLVQHLTPSVPSSIIKKVKQGKSKKKKKTKQGKTVDQVEAVLSQPSSQDVHGVHSSVPHIESVNKDSPGFEVESKTQDGPEDQKDVKNMSDMVSHRIQSEIPLSRQSQATKNESEDKTLVMNKESPSENLGRSLKNMEETLLISSKQSRTPLKKDVQSSTNEDKKAESSGGHIFSLKEKETVDSRLPTESESGSQIPLGKVSPGESSNDVEKSTLSSISVFDQDSQKKKMNKKKKKKKNTKVSENLGDEAFEQLNTSLASSSNSKTSKKKLEADLFMNTGEIVGSKQPQEEVPQDIQKAIHSLFHLYDGQSSLKLRNDLSLYKATLNPTDLSDSAAKMMAQFEKNANFCMHHVSSLLGEEESLNRMYSVHSQAGQYFTTLGWKNNMSNLSDKVKKAAKLLKISEEWPTFYEATVEEWEAAEKSIDLLNETEKKQLHELFPNNNYENRLATLYVMSHASPTTYLYFRFEGLPTVKELMKDGICVPVLFWFTNLVSRMQELAVIKTNDSAQFQAIAEEIIDLMEGFIYQSKKSLKPYRVNLGNWVTSKTRDFITHSLIFIVGFRTTAIYAERNFEGFDTPNFIFERSETKSDRLKGYRFTFGLAMGAKYFGIPFEDVAYMMQYLKDELLRKQSLKNASHDELSKPGRSNGKPKYLRPANSASPGTEERQAGLPASTFVVSMEKCAY